MNHNQIYYKNQFLLSVLLLSILFLLFIPIGLFSGGDVNYLMLLGYMLLINTPFIIMSIYYGINYKYYKKVELKYIQKVKLEKTYPGMRYCSGFIVNMNIDGKIYKKETKAIYTAGFNLFHLGLDEYIGEIVTIGYDENKDNVVIICEEV